MAEGVTGLQEQVWDAIFREHGIVFAKPHELMPELAVRLTVQGARDILDLGCGTGRHTRFLAERGFAVCALDSAPEALRLTEQALREAGRSATVQRGDMFARLPYDDEQFDAVVAIQTIHHATLATIERLIAELHRVLRRGGLIMATVPSERNQATRFRQVEPGTYLPLDGREAGLLHHFFSLEELQSVFAAFTVESVRVDRAAHYCLLAHKD